MKFLKNRPLILTTIALLTLFLVAFLVMQSRNPPSAESDDSFILINTSQDYKKIESKTLDQLALKSLEYKYSLKREKITIVDSIYAGDNVYGSFLITVNEKDYLGYLSAQQGEELLLKTISLYPIAPKEPITVVHTSDLDQSEAHAYSNYIELGYLSDPKMDTIEIFSKSNLDIIKVRDHKKTFLAVEKEKPLSIVGKSNGKVIYQIENAEEENQTN
ncbi:hypothetical protein [Gorillibacterium timonense]|uniref:hypothetical protein n=1 Tax=Gorillibacterium timonense TaxID=1689269 RepID=UPI00071DDA8D|nr:hypothetical protein [Gorillibacterium timonense]